MLVFKITEKESLERERLNKTANWTDISFFINFKIFIGILLGSEVFWEERAEIIELIVFLSVGERKKSLYSIKGIIYEIPWRVFDWGLYIQSHLWEIIVESICSFRRVGN